MNSWIANHLLPTPFFRFAYEGNPDNGICPLICPRARLSFSCPRMPERMNYLAEIARHLVEVQERTVVVFRG